MGVSASLSSFLATKARAELRGWGAWYADVSLDGEHELAGTVELKVADLTLQGTVLSGGPMAGRSRFWLVGGKGGWGKTIPAKEYASDAGVKKLTVLRDAAAACGEDLDESTVSSSDRVGPAFTRPEGPASWALEELAPGAWYVGEDGRTRLGRRPAVALATPATRIEPVDRARATVTLAAESIATILPGIIVDGLEAVDVRHEISAEGGLRSKIWGKQGAGLSRYLAAFQTMLEQLDPDRRFRGVTEYRVVSQEDDYRVNLQPIRVSSGMPDLFRVSTRPGLSGGKSMLHLSSHVLVGFADSDPARPYIAAFEAPDGEGFMPISTSIDAETLLELGKEAAATKLGLGVRPVVATGDLAGGIFPVAATQAKVFV